MPLPEQVLVGIAAFASTNIDDIFILMIFFADSRFRPLQVIAGQYAGIAVLVVVSLLAALAALAFPENLVGLLGLLPIGIGIKQLFDLRQPQGDVDRPDFSYLSRMRVPAVAAVTIANGADNISVYVPLFTVRSPAEMFTIVVIFGLMAAVWCGAGYWLVHRSTAGVYIRRVGRVVLPFVLIGLGVWILAEGFAG